MAERLAQQPEQFVQAMAQSELGLSEHRFPNQWTAALSAGISTALGRSFRLFRSFLGRR